MRLPQIGQKFRDRYLVEEVLGEGAFGAVYAATDTMAARPVALKILKPDGSEGAYDPKTKARFEREIKVVANLRSPHTVSLFDCGATDDGLLFSVFERVPGEDLSQHLSRVGRLPVGATVHIARQVLLSLQEAHARGLLHRDIKPHNIRVFRHQDDPLTVKVLDFGLARDTRRDRAVVTEQGEIIGTPRYMAPEQLMDAEITPAADVYSLGIVMLEMLLGAEQLHGSSFSDQLERMRAGHVFAMHGLEASGLIPVIRRMTARHATDRQPDASAVLRALDQWQVEMSNPQPAVPRYSSSGEVTRPARSLSSSSQSHSSISSPTVPRPSSGTTTVDPGPNRALVGLAVGVVVAAVVLIGVVVSLVGKEEPPPTVITQRPVSGLIAADEPSEPDALPPAVPDVITETVDAGSTTDGCGTAPIFTGKGYLERDTLLARERWLTYIPTAYDPDEPRPLVVLLHPSGQSPEDLLRYSRFDLVANEHGFVLIAPRDTDPMSWRDGVRELEILHSIVSETRAQLCIDERRIYVVTQGHGGYAANLLVCEPWVAAVATNAFRMDQHLEFCAPDVTTPYLLMSPDDGQDPWEGGTGCAGARKRSVAKVEEMWRERNGCTGKRRRGFEHKGSTCYSWSCETEFQSCHVKGGHNWPGSPRRAMDLVGCDGESPDFPMAQHVWSFFAELEPAAP